MNKENKMSSVKRQKVDSTLNNELKPLTDSLDPNFNSSQVVPNMPKISLQKPNIMQSHQSF